MEIIPLEVYKFSKMFLLLWFFMGICSFSCYFSYTHTHTHTCNAFFQVSNAAHPSSFSLSRRHGSVSLAVTLSGYVLSMPLGHGGPDSSDFCHSELALPLSCHLLTAGPKLPTSLPLSARGFD